MWDNYIELIKIYFHNDRGILTLRSPVVTQKSFIKIQATSTWRKRSVDVNVVYTYFIYTQLYISYGKLIF